MAGFLKANQAGALGLSPGDKADLVTVQSPDGAKFTVARKVAPQFSAFLTDLHGTGYALNPKTSGGFNDRTIAGTGTRSQHAFGNAIDLNWDKNPRGSARYDLPQNVGDIAAKHGIAWGGTWKNPDPMHFEVSTLSPGSQASSYVAANAANEVKTNGAPMQAPMSGAPIAGGPSPLTPPNARYSKLADAFMSQGINASPQGWGDLIRGLGSMVSGQGYAQKFDEEQKAYQGQLAQRLMGAGDTNSMAGVLMQSGDPDLMKAGINARVAANAPKALPNDIQEYQFAMQQNKQLGRPEVPYADWIKEVKAKQADSGFGTTPVSYVDAQGNTVYTQMSKAGGRKDVELPPGAKWTPGVEYKDTGTEFVPVQKKTGEIAGPAIAKNVAGEQAAQEVGKAAGGAQVALPAAKTMVDNARKTIDELRSHPGLNVGTGASTLFDPRSWVPGTNAYDFQAKNKQAQGQGFMAARDALKGAGQVTDFEGAKGEQAIANLDTAQSKEQYLKALDTLESMMRKSYLDLERKSAGGRQPSAPTPEAPPIDALKQKYGLE